MGYVGSITSEDSLKQYLGTINVAWMSDVDAQGFEGTGAVQQCIDAAESDVNSILAVPGCAGNYVIPISFGTNPKSAALVMRTNQIAGFYLYEKRLLIGMTGNADAPNFDAMRMQAEDWLKKVYYGDVILIGAATTGAQGSIPVPVAIPQVVTPYGAGIGWGAGYGLGWGWYGSAPWL